MKKIISLFQRNYDGDRLVRNEVTPGAEWVIAGEGIPTRKYDGTCCMVRDGKFYKRYEIKPGGKAPPNFEPATEVDDNTGKQQGWVPVGDGPDDRWHWEGFRNTATERGTHHDDGTYELCGPKVQGNHDGMTAHVLIRHGGVTLPDPFMHPLPVPRDFNGIWEYLRRNEMEGIVWHHPDGRMVKIKTKDFGLIRPEKNSARKGAAA